MKPWTITCWTSSKTILFILNYTETKDGAPGKPKITPNHSYAKDDKKLANLDVHAKKMTDMVIVAYEGAAEIRLIQEKNLN